MKIEINKLLVLREFRPELAKVIDFINNTWIVEFESDGCICEYSSDEAEKFFEELNPPMVLYCGTGKSRFCSNYRSGFYYLSESGTSILLDSQIVDGCCSIDELRRACKLKAFW